MPAGDLCTLDEIKLHPAFRRLRSATVDTSDEEFIQMSISAVSSRFELTTGRRFQLGTYTEYFSPMEGQSAVLLRGYPISSVTSLVQSATSTWTDGAMSADAYGVDTISGIVRMRSATFNEGFNTLRVVYVGGYDPIPSDLKYACMMQVAHEVELAPKSSLSSQSSQTGGQASYQPMQYLPAVQTLLASYAMARA